MKERIQELVAILDLIPWVSLGLMVVFTFLVTCLIRWHLSPKSREDFDFVDYFKNPVTRKADLGNLVIIFFAVLSAWVVVRMVLSDKPVETMLLGVLGIFVLNGVAKKGIDAMSGNNQPPPPTEGPK